MKIHSQINKLKKQFIKFSFVGVLNTFLSYAIFTLLFKLDINYLIASLFAYIIAAINSFYLNKRWTFKFPNKATIGLVVGYLLVNLSSLLINMALMYSLVSILKNDPMLSQLISTVLVIIVNFLGYRLVFYIRPINDYGSNNIISKKIQSKS